MFIETYEKYKEAEDAISFIEDEVMGVEVEEIENGGGLEEIGVEVVEAEGSNSLAENVERDIQGMGVKVMEAEGANSLMENVERDIQRMGVEVIEAVGVNSLVKNVEPDIRGMGVEVMEAENGGDVELMAVYAVEAKLGGVEKAASGLVERKKNFYDLEAKSLILENYNQLVNYFLQCSSKFAQVEFTHTRNV